NDRPHSALRERQGALLAEGVALRTGACILAFVRRAVPVRVAVGILGAGLVRGVALDGAGHLRGLRVVVAALPDVVAGDEATLLRVHHAVVTCEAVAVLGERAC